MKKVCIVGVSGKLGRYMVQHALDLNEQRRSATPASNRLIGDSPRMQQLRVPGVSRSGCARIWAV